MNHKFLSIIFVVFFLISCQSQTNQKIITGAEQTDKYIPLLKNKNVAIVANHTSLINQTHLVDSLLNLKINIVNGDLSIKEIDGKLKVNNVNGDVQLRESNYKGININNVNGDIIVDGDYELEEDAKIKIVSGDIKLNCKEYKNDKKIVISSVTGDNVVSDTFPEGVVVQHGGLKELKNLKFLKDSFKPMIKQFKEHFKHMPFDKVKEEVNPKKNNEENIQLILNMLSEGKISAEDAEKLISALKK